MKLDRQSVYKKYKNLETNRHVIRSKIKRILAGTLCIFSLLMMTKGEVIAGQKSIPNEYDTVYEVTDHDEQVQDIIDIVRNMQKKAVEDAYGKSDNEINTVADLKKIIAYEHEKREVFNKYAGVYGVDADKAYLIATTITDDFKDERYLSSFVIGSTNYGGKEIAYPSEEAGIISFLRSLSKNPELFNVSSNEVLTGYTERCNSYEAFSGDVAEAYGLDKISVLSIFYFETGRFTSSAFLDKNNPAGIMTDDGLKKFNSKEQGIIDSVLNLYVNYYRNNPGISYEQIGRRYCPPNPDEWAMNVRLFYKEIQNKPELFNNSNSIDKSM